MKNLTNRFVSFMLVFALALSLSAPAFAAEYSGTNELNNEVGTIDALEEIDFLWWSKKKHLKMCSEKYMPTLLLKRKKKHYKLLQAIPIYLAIMLKKSTQLFQRIKQCVAQMGYSELGLERMIPQKY